MNDYLKSLQSSQDLSGPKMNLEMRLRLNEQRHQSAV
jgi:hypothetical protein